MNEDKRFLSFADVGTIYGVSPRTVRRWVSQGRLTVRRVGPRAIRLDREHVYDVLGRPQPVRPQSK